MRIVAWALLLLSSFAITAGREPAGRVIEVSTAEELMATFREPLENVTVRLAPGTYPMTPSADVDSSLRTPITVGLRITGRGVRLIGAGADQVVVVTNAGRGIYFKDCVDCEVEGVTVTGGIRDAGALNTAVVAANSSVRVAHCVIRDNGSGSVPPRTNIRFDGIFGRSHTLLTVEYCEILRNVGDAVSIRDDAHAIIKRNMIDGALNNSFAAVTISCDAQAIIERNHIRDYHVGIGVSGSANVEVRANLIERAGAVGIGWGGGETVLPRALIEAIESNAVYHCEGTGLPQAIIESNVVYQCEGTGVGIVSPKPPRSRRSGGKLANNLIVETGTRNTGIVCRGSLVTGNMPEDFVIRGNTFFANEAGVTAPDRNMPREIFWRARRQWTRTYRNTAVGVDGRHKFHESAFLTRYGRWAN